MGFRVVLLENEVQIRLKLDNLIVRKEEKDIWIPPSDISMLVIDNMRITVTARVMASLANYNIGVIWCDQNHLPIGFYCSYDNHSRISKQIRYQIAWMSEDYDRIWKEIVKSKYKISTVYSKNWKKSTSSRFYEDFLPRSGTGGFT